MKYWYALRLQAGREGRIKENLEKRVKSAGLEEKFGQMVIPTETVQEIAQGGKRRTKIRKMHSGYLYLEVDTFEDRDEGERVLRMDPDAYFLVRETPGIGDFIGDSKGPAPMTGDDIKRVLGVADDEDEPEEVAFDVKFGKGDHVRIKSGPFENHEGVVDEVLPARGMVRVLVTIFGRSTPVDVELWQVVPDTTAH